METHEIKVEQKNLGSKIILKGKVKKITVNKYWDSHGDEIDWGTDTTKFDTEKEFEIVEKQQKIFNQIFEVWNLYVDGERFDTEFELTGYKLSGNNLTLHGCVGAG